MTFFGATSIGFETTNPYLISEDYMKITLTNSWDNGDGGASIVNDILTQTDITRSQYAYPVLGVKYTILFAIENEQHKIVAAQQFYVGISVVEGGGDGVFTMDMEGTSWDSIDNPNAGTTLRLYLINAELFLDLGG